MDRISEEFIGIKDDLAAKEQWNRFQQMSEAEKQLTFQMMYMANRQQSRAVRELLSKTGTTAQP